jgi:hypothetical protein
MIERKHWPESITDERLLAAAEQRMFGLDSTGFCIACGNEQGGCEPDARRYRCEACDTRQVYGAEELLMVSM